ncbi:hypothetical protein CLV33_102123 [Jejuia pallidilutea]|uniref:Uncharacterized protein n=1 Tax=Jejuia pallidilutea TaxID=504487 RepID=A0A362X4P1_9FLAO|nr:hypothetical protein [Jejuia pallidilutea]PQV50264.1 hypothetical protein CLV33_102123 [Jejuia pallidilutea]
MNKKQLNILVKKIIPIALVLFLVIGGLIAIPVIRGYGDKLEKENEEWFSNPKNQEKIKTAINSYDNKSKSQPTQSDFKKIQDIVFELNGWSIKSDESMNTPKTGMLVLTKGVDYFNIMYVIADDFSSLDDYSNNQNEKITRNLQQQGIDMMPLGKENSNVKGKAAIIQSYEMTFDGDQQPKMIVASFKHKNYYYTFSYPTKSKNVPELWGTIKLID